MTFTIFLVRRLSVLGSQRACAGYSGGGSLPLAPLPDPLQGTNSFNLSYACMSPLALGRAEASRALPEEREAVGVAVCSC